MTSQRRAACVILLRPDPTGQAPYQFYLVRRAKDLAFLGGFHVFPGGTAEITDAHAPAFVSEWDTAIASTAVRETFEETGILLTDGADNSSPADRASMRQTVLESPAHWPQLLADRNLRINPELLRPMGRWVTPPYSASTFDAQYFIAWLPANQNPSIIDGELTEGEWLSTQEALEGHEAGKYFLCYPVLETLRVMHAHPQDLVAASNDIEAQSFGAQPKTGGEILHGIRIYPLQAGENTGSLHNNCYVIGGDELVIIDPVTSIETEVQRLFDFLTSLQNETGRLKEIWLTHEYSQSNCALKALQDTFDLPIAAHPNVAQRLSGQFEKLRTITPESVLPIPVAKDHVRLWRAIDCPGYADGYLSFFEQTGGSLVTGPMVRQALTIAMPPVCPSDPGDYLASLERLEALPLGFLLTAHGPPIATAQKTIHNNIVGNMTPEPSTPQP